MYVEQQIVEPRLKPCPFCNVSCLLYSKVSYEKGDDDGYRVGCQCGWAGRRVSKWYSNKQKLIDAWNSYIIEGEFQEIKQE